MSSPTLFTPKAPAASRMAGFASRFAARTGRDCSDFAALHAASVADRAAFWDAVWDEGGVIGDKGGRRLIDDSMPGARFFPDATLNYAENLMRVRDEREVIVYRGEDGETLRLSGRDLAALVSRLQQAMSAAGIVAGDRVAAILPNRPEAVAIMLAAASLGAIFSSCSPDFGVRGVLDRFGQIEPKLLFAADGDCYAGKRIELRERLAAIMAGLPATTRLIVVPVFGDAEATASSVQGATTLAGFLDGFRPGPLQFRRLPFDHPLVILYSSGTTGMPKCIVHRAGGVLLKHLSEQQLHCDIRPGDRVFYFTTLGWMMWNWLVSALASEATLVLFDGSPFHPSPEILFDYAQAERITLFGTSAKYIDSLKKHGLAPATSHDLSSIRMVCSTGSPLVPDAFDYVYDKMTPEAHLASVSGGTDIVGCFVLGNPLSPVRRGEIQGPGLGLAIEVRDEDGQPVAEGKGELVCARAFPSMPLMFWNDPDGTRYRAAYFDRFPGVWAHGDFAEWTASGGMIIHGRSDATLNPGGVRIGTAEIYAQVERIPEVIEAIAIGQEHEGDVRVVLFVRLAPGVVLDKALESRIRQTIREGASPRHVPAIIVAVAHIPRTRSGKITELAVREVIHGRPVRNIEALANPEALALYADLPALRATGG